MKKTIKISAILLALIMAVSVFAISPISASAEENWTNIYDWESEDSTSAITKVSDGDLTRITFSRKARSQYPTSWNVSSTETNQYVIETNGNASMNRYLSIVPTDKISSAVNIRVLLYKRTNTAMRFGVKMDGKIWLTDQLFNNSTRQWFGNYYFGTYTFKNGSDTLQLTAENTKNVEAILIVPGGTVLIDNIDYDIAESSNVTASFTGADDTVADVANGGKFPTATISGKTFVGWSDGTKLYKAGATIDISENTTFTAVGVAFGTNEEASVRWSADDAKRGIKFTSYVNKADFDALTAVDGSSVAYVGAYITDEEGKSLEVSNDTSSNGAAPNWINADDDNYYFGSSATNFAGVDETYLTKVLYAQMYIKVVYADGSEATITGAKTTEGRTMQGVAKKAYNDANDAQKKVLEEVYNVTAE